MHALTLKVYSRMEDNCQELISQELSPINGIKRVLAQPKLKNFKIEFDPAILKSFFIQRKLKEMGYHFNVIPT